MKAYCVSSWGDNEYFISKEKAEARAAELRKVEKTANDEHTKVLGSEPIEAECYEIDIQE